MCIAYKIYQFLVKVKFCMFHIYPNNQFITNNANAGTTAVLAY